METTTSLLNRPSLLSVELRQVKLPGLGAKSLEVLSDSGVKTLAEFLMFTPLRYRIKSKLSIVTDFEEGSSYCVEGLVVGVNSRGKVTKIKVKDNSGHLFFLTFFHFTSWHHGRYGLGRRLQIWGEASYYQGLWEMRQPEIEIITSESQFEPRVECVYPKIGKITSKMLLKAFQGFWRQYQSSSSASLLQILDSLRIMHAIGLSAQEVMSFEKLQAQAQKKLSHLEALHYFSYLHQKEALLHYQGEPLASGPIYQTLLDSLPFTLTQGQREVLKELDESFCSGSLKPHLIQGDVGSGKTILGFLALCRALDNQQQGALMAPTELLARQHYDNFKKLLPSHCQKILYLSGSVSTKEKKNLYSLLSSNQPFVVIGTHALFQDEVKFHSLRVIVVDEQQRFGVKQRAQLLSKASRNLAYQITLSATPIPRTLAMATYGPISLSLLKEKPAGRQEIKTYTIASDQQQIVYKSIRNCVRGNQQCYWVCPLITESEYIQAQNVEQAYARLCEQLSELRIEVIHGQVPIANREKILESFRRGEVDVLVSTLVIEVGVDSPTASLIVIESPERLGLSQLHQLRGRVGRGRHQGYCLLVYDSQLTSQALERLKALCESQDGFYLSDVDLKLRGPGEVLGTRQTGQIQFKFFNIVEDEDSIPNILEQCRDLDQNSKSLLNEFFGEADENPYV